MLIDLKSFPNSKVRKTYSRRLKKKLLSFLKKLLKILVTQVILSDYK